MPKSGSHRMFYRVLQRQMNASIYMCLYASAHMWNSSAMMRYVSLMSLFGVPSDPLSGALSDPLFGAPSEPPTEESGVLSEESYIVCRVSCEVGIVECGVCIFRKRRKSIAPATQNDFWHATKHVWKSRRAMPATQNNITTYFLIDTARPQENQRLETRHVGASKRAFRARHPPILILCSFKNRCFPTSFLIDLQIGYFKIIQKCYTTATQSEDRCRQVPRLPRKVPQRRGQLTAPKRATRANPMS